MKQFQRYVVFSRHEHLPLLVLAAAAGPVLWFAAGGTNGLLRGGWRLLLAGTGAAAPARLGQAVR